MTTKTQQNSFINAMQQTLLLLLLLTTVLGNPPDPQEPMDDHEEEEMNYMTLLPYYGDDDSASAGTSSQQQPLPSTQPQSLPDHSLPTQRHTQLIDPKTIQQPSFLSKFKSLNLNEGTTPKPKPDSTAQTKSLSSYQPHQKSRIQSRVRVQSKFAKRIIETQGASTSSQTQYSSTHQKTSRKRKYLLNEPQNEDISDNIDNPYQTKKIRVEYELILKYIETIKKTITKKVNQIKDKFISCKQLSHNQRSQCQSECKNEGKLLLARIKNIDNDISAYQFFLIKKTQNPKIQQKYMMESLKELNTDNQDDKIVLDYVITQVMSITDRLQKNFDSLAKQRNQIIKELVSKGEQLREYLDKLTECFWKLKMMIFQLIDSD